MKTALSQSILEALVTSLQEVGNDRALRAAIKLTVGITIGKLYERQLIGEDETLELITLVRVA